jgi:hypothetical protein
VQQSSKGWSLVPVNNGQQSTRAKATVGGGAHLPHEAEAFLRHSNQQQTTISWSKCKSSNDNEGVFPNAAEGNNDNGMVGTLASYHGIFYDVGDENTESITWLTASKLPGEAMERCHGSNLRFLCNPARRPFILNSIPCVYKYRALLSLVGPYLNM